MTKVLIVEDNKFTRSYLENMIEKSEAFTLAGSLKDAEQVSAFCYLNDVHMILMDVQTLHGHSGLAAAQTIKEQRPDILVVIVTSLVDSAILTKAKQIGVDSMWYKDHGEEEILDVMQRAVQGEHIFPDRAPNVEVGDAWSDDLSETQKDILRLYIQGNSYAAIGKALNIEASTVRYHMIQMIQKCGFSSKQQLIAAAIDSTIVAALDEM